MNAESTKPIPVKGPASGSLSFLLRLLLDLQLLTIVTPLRKSLATLSGEVLDIGAGQSPWRDWLPATARYQGVDIDNSADFGMQRQADVTYYDGSTLPFPADAFDAAICIEVLEHAAEPQLLLADACRVLKPGATLLLSVPWSARRHHVPFDFHRFTREQLHRMLARAGFDDIEITERGNDVCAVANKLIVICWRIVHSPPRRALLWTLPLALLTVPVAAAFLIAAHVSLQLDLGSRDDPLGYFVRCRKAAGGGAAAGSPAAGEVAASALDPSTRMSGIAA